MTSGYLHLNDPKQEVIFENDSDGKITLFPAVKIRGKEVWYPAYSMDQIYPVALLTIPSGKTINLKYSMLDSSKKLNFRVVNHRGFIDAGYSVAKTFSLKYKPIKIYASDFNYSWQKKVDIKYSNEFNLLVMFILSVFGIWFHVNMAKKKILWRLLAWSLTALSAFMSFILITIIASH